MTELSFLEQLSLLDKAASLRIAEKEELAEVTEKVVSLRSENKDKTELADGEIAKIRYIVAELMDRPCLLRNLLNLLSKMWLETKPDGKKVMLPVACQEIIYHNDETGEVVDILWPFGQYPRLWIKTQLLERGDGEITKLSSQDMEDLEEFFRGQYIETPLVASTLYDLLNRVNSYPNEKDVDRKIKMLLGEGVAVGEEVVNIKTALDHLEEQKRR